MSKRRSVWTIRGMMIMIAIVAVILGGERFLYQLVDLWLGLTNPPRMPYRPMLVTFILNVPIWLVLACLFGYMRHRWSAADRDR
jgi:hypothetical protein